MICHNAREVKLVNNAGLVVVDGKRLGNHECIIRNGASASAIRASSSVPVWIHTKISNEGIAKTQEMFEYIWANKYILNGIVFDISNFTHPTQFIPPSMYSYKIAIDYIVRNIVYPFEKEYGISTPAIMIDGRNHICRLEHLYDLHEQGLRVCKHLWEKQSPASQMKLHLIVGSLLDNSHL